MIPLQALSDPAMAVVALNVLMVFVVLFGFIWAYGKIREGPESDHGPGRGGHGA